MRAAFLAGLLAIGCEAARYQVLQVSSRPAGAEIYLDGELVGRTPMQLEVERTDHHQLFLKKPGHKPELFVLELHRAEDGIDYLTPADIGARLLPAREDGRPDGRANGNEQPDAAELELQRRLQIELEREGAEQRD